MRSRSVPNSQTSASAGLPMTSPAGAASFALPVAISGFHEPPLQRAARDPQSLFAVMGNRSHAGRRSAASGLNRAARMAGTKPDAMPITAAPNAAAAMIAGPM